MGSFLPGPGRLPGDAFAMRDDAALDIAVLPGDGIGREVAAAARLFA